MQNVTMKNDPATVLRIVENHINESLADGNHARVTMMAAGYPANTDGRAGANVEITATFDVVKES